MFAGLRSTINTGLQFRNRPLVNQIPVSQPLQNSVLIIAPVQRFSVTLLPVLNTKSIRPIKPATVSDTFSSWQYLPDYALEKEN
jgi:hypothetical protein